MKKYTIFFFLIIIYLSGLVSYSNSFDGEFVFDDFNSIVAQEKNFKLKRLDEMWRINKSRFIPFITYKLNYRIDELNPRGYHVFNFSIHILNAFIIFFLVRTVQNVPMVRKKTFLTNKLLPLFSALLFSVHPIQTQTVNYVSQRPTLIAALFYMTTILFYLQFRLTRNKTGAVIFYITAAIAALLAFISKENSYSLPLTIIFTDLLFFGKKLKNKTEYIKSLIFFLLAGGVIYINYSGGEVNLISKISSMNMLYEEKISRWEYLWTQFKVIVSYLGILFIPYRLNIDHDIPLSRSFWEAPSILSFLLIILITGASLLGYKRNRIFTFGVIFFFIALAVESSIIPIKDLVFEHRVYLPSAGFFLAVCSILVKIKNKKYLYPAVIVLISVYIFLTYNRNKVWQSEYNLWKNAVINSPKKARAHFNLGVAGYTIGNFEEAKREFSKTIQLDSNYTDAYRNLGAIYESEGKKETALALYEKGLASDYFNSKIRASMAMFYSKSGNYREAVEQYNKILEYDGQNAKVYNDLGIVYFMQNNPEAIAYFKKAAEIEKTYENAFQNLANSLWHFGFKDEAYHYYLKLLKINPENSQALYFMSNL